MSGLELATDGFVLKFRTRGWTTDMVAGRVDDLAKALLWPSQWPDANTVSISNRRPKKLTIPKHQVPKSIESLVKSRGYWRGQGRPILSACNAPTHVEHSAVVRLVSRWCVGIRPFVHVHGVEGNS